MHHVLVDPPGQLQRANVQPLRLDHGRVGRSRHGVRRVGRVDEADVGAAHCVVDPALHVQGLEQGQDVLLQPVRRRAVGHEGVDHQQHDVAAMGQVCLGLDVLGLAAVLVLGLGHPVLELLQPPRHLERIDACLALLVRVGVGRARPGYRVRLRPPLARSAHDRRGADVAKARDRARVSVLAQAGTSEHEGGGNQVRDAAPGAAAAHHAIGRVPLVPVAQLLDRVDIDARIAHQLRHVPALLRRANVMLHRLQPAAERVPHPGPVTPRLAVLLRISARQGLVQLRRVRSRRRDAALQLMLVFGEACPVRRPCPG